jgi:hypothetical protein
MGMPPWTLELLRDILTEAEFLAEQAMQTNLETFLHDEVLKRAFVRSPIILVLWNMPAPLCRPGGHQRLPITCGTRTDASYSTGRVLEFPLALCSLLLPDN